jgi:hypothetical protein
MSLLQFHYTDYIATDGTMNDELEGLLKEAAMA